MWKRALADLGMDARVDGRRVYVSSTTTREGGAAERSPSATPTDALVVLIAALRPVSEEWAAWASTLLLADPSLPRVVVLEATGPDGRAVSR